MRSKKKIRKRFVLEGLITLLIVLSPIMFYSYKYMPSDTESLDFILFKVGTNGFADARTAVWFYLIKLIPLVLLVIWFVTSKQWWYHAVLIPISMYSFQLYSAIFESSQEVDENEVFYVIAVSMVVVPIVYFIRVKLVDKHVHGIDLDAMDTELQILKEKEELRKEREKLEERQKTLSKKV
ncbi:MAG: hypothetical protein RIM83_03300 [Allomuricauda sp.]|jgi:hypothetical protein|uniref:hypothetical protein n=1 Tax=Allomuricauda sp. CP2A TaxID=1848189 RepID=UPI00082AD123|nr:hypothetical protein [Muricauda sp. CP2A]